MFTTLGATFFTIGAKLVLALTSLLIGASWKLSLAGGLVFAAAGAGLANGGNWIAKRPSNVQSVADDILFMFNGMIGSEVTPVMIYGRGRWIVCWEKN